VAWQSSDAKAHREKKIMLSYRFRQQNGHCTPKSSNGAALIVCSWLNGDMGIEESRSAT
jgi:hypothetical protein